MAFAVALLATTSLAQDARLSKTFETCMEKSGGVTVAMLDCAALETDLQDKKLNAAYQSLLQELSAKRRMELREAQRQWLAFRKANCDFYADPDGGTLASVNAASCFVNMTANRARELENLKN